MNSQNKKAMDPHLAVNVPSNTDGHIQNQYLNADFQRQTNNNTELRHWDFMYRESAHQIQHPRDKATESNIESLILDRPGKGKPAKSIKQKIQSREAISVKKTYQSFNKVTDSSQAGAQSKTYQKFEAVKEQANYLEFAKTQRVIAKQQNEKPKAAIIAQPIKEKGPQSIETSLS